MKSLLLVPIFSLLGEGIIVTPPVNTIPENTIPAVTATPPPAPVACYLGGVPCPTGSTCTQTSTCGGVCTPSAQVPPLIGCTIGDRRGCPTGSTCTPTQTCGPGPCGGACITTNPVIPSSTTAPPLTQPCVVGANDCPGGQLCTQTQACGGLCIATPTPPGPTLVPCTVGASGCPARSTCTPTVTCPPKGPCGGLCIGTPTATPTPTAIPCGGRHDKPCPPKYECVRKPYGSGTCQPKAPHY